LFFILKEINEDKVNKEVNLELEKSEDKNLKEEEIISSLTNNTTTTTSKNNNNELIKEVNIEIKKDDNNLNLGTNDNDKENASSSSKITRTIVETIVTNDESVSTPLPTVDATPGATVGTEATSKTQRKRKWLNNDSLKTLSNNESVTISSDTLKVNKKLAKKLS
jgi:hypothetical protein